MKSISHKLFNAQEWSLFLDSLSDQQRSILISLGRRALSVREIAIECMADGRSIDSQLRKLKVDGLVNQVEGKMFAICVPGLVDQAEKQRICGKSQIDKEKVETFVEGEIYKAVVGTFEFLEHQQLISGNGHHMAQKIAAAAREEIQKRWFQTSRT